MAKAVSNEIKFSKAQIMTSKKYKNFYVLNELLKDDTDYTLAQVDAMLSVYGRKAGNE